MYIANPIYDVVFKFMMEDNKVAKAFLSAIIGENVVELDFTAQEHTLRIPKKKEPAEEKTVEEQAKTGESDRCLTVCRMDFSAKIALANDVYKTVLIELQKAKLPTDILRFRRYLGVNYQNSGNVSEKEKVVAREIYCIFLLGYDIGYPANPIIQIVPGATDAITKEKLEILSNEFICALHHRSWIVQIASLKKHHRSDLEKLLSVFDQENQTKNHHIMNVHEEDFPEDFRHIVRRLQMAAESEKVQIDMEMEDDYLLDLQEKEREISQQRQTIAEQKQTIAEKDKVLEEKDKVLEEKDKVLEEKDKVLEEKDRIIREMEEQLKKFRNDSNSL
ncbi:MAG: hypothetical protein LBD45_09010 [Bacteroidales bacterium]|jgi:hypothetical protein|nr:hypothetical protein [Bacteroidales bacterium]